MKKLLLLLSLSLFTGVLFAQSGQLQKPPSLEEKTKLYPVPAKSTESITLSFDQPVTASSAYLVRSDGWVPPGGWFNPPHNEQKVTMQLPKLSSGFYILKVSLSDGSFFSKKFIVYR